MTHESDSKLIQLLEQFEQGPLDKDQFIERLKEFDTEEIQTLQLLLKTVYEAKLVIEGEVPELSPTWGIGRPTGAGRPRTSGLGGRSGSGRRGTSRRGS